MRNVCEGSLMEIELPPDFKEFFRSLNAKRVKYLLIGGYAVILNGYSRNTSDLDISIASDAENAGRFIEALAEFGFSAPDLTPEHFSGTTKHVLRMGVEPVKIEILNYLEGVNFEQAYGRRVQKRIEDIQIDVIEINDLIANKISVGRLQDLTDVEKLRERNDI